MRICVFDRLEDFENSCSAYEKAIELGEDYLTHLNYAVTLQRNDEVERSRVQFEIFERLFADVAAEGGDVDPDVMVQADLMRRALS